MTDSKPAAAEPADKPDYNAEIFPPALLRIVEEYCKSPRSHGPTELQLRLLTDADRICAERQISYKRFLIYLSRRDGRHLSTYYRHLQPLRAPRSIDPDAAAAVQPGHFGSTLACRRSISKRRLEKDRQRLAAKLKEINQRIECIDQELSRLEQGD